MSISISFDNLCCTQERIVIADFSYVSSILYFVRLVFDTCIKEAASGDSLGHNSYQCNSMPVLAAGCYVYLYNRCFIVSHLGFK